MTKEELEKEAYQFLIQATKDKKLFYFGGNLEEILAEFAEPREKRITELEAQIEKLIDFVLSKTDCCDVCPITDTCNNSEGTCHYAGILAKCEEEVTRKWLMQFISKEIKEKCTRLN